MTIFTIMCGKKFILRYFFATLAFLFSCTKLVFCQQQGLSFECGYYPKDLKRMKKDYQRYGQHFGVIGGEKIACVGAGGANLELNAAVFNDNIQWTLQDIDTFCLNNIRLEKMIKYYEKLTSKPIVGEFNIVIGNDKSTNLTKNYYDRILMSNVYHELSEKEIISKEIYDCLKENGLIVLMERMGREAGEFHSDCGHPRLLEPDFLSEMEKIGFKLIEKVIAEKKSNLIFYTFTKTLF